MAGLARLEKEKLNKWHGNMISEMLKIDPSEELENYARLWLNQFPEHTDAPELLGRWLLAFPKEETFRLTRHYLELDCPVLNLYRLIQCACMTEHCDQFKIQISKLLEKNPNQFFWALVFSLKKENSEMIETLILRYFELNETNKDFYPVTLAHSSQSFKVLEKILNWCKKTGIKNEHMPKTLAELFRSIPNFAPELKDSLISFVKRWVEENQDNEDVGNVISSLLSYTKTDESLDFAINWSLNHESNESLWFALNAILRLHKKLQTTPPVAIIDYTKNHLQSLSPDERPPVFVDALLNLDSSAETIKLAKETCFEHPAHYLLIKLLPEHSCERLKSIAQNHVEKYMHFSQDEVLVALLKGDPTDERSIEIAKKWLLKFPEHEQNNVISNMLKK
ncbi:MAG: hypothetical protein KIT34_06665 [Cyanobacteria bacterium TGS_CYA1]|nr:hypothetical protein [Cyanobacteria bacterium TGS_CYA1]